MTEYSEERLSETRTRVKAAEADLHRQEVADRLCKKEGLAYASLTDDQLGPMLVTYRHQPIGEMHTTSPSALQDWYAQPYMEDGSLGASSGPHGTARAAAAALIRGREEPRPDEAG